MINQLDEVDRLTLLLNHSKVSEVETKLRELALLTEKTQYDLVRARQAQISSNKVLQAKYSLAPEDKINPDTGAITRYETPHDQAAQPAPVAPN